MITFVCGQGPRETCTDSITNCSELVLILVQEYFTAARVCVQITRL